MNTRHMFPGGNTSEGFYNRFSGIFPDWQENNRLYILKGGPGVGKNTFMKRVGKKAQSKNLEVEYFHCASDAESLDAVRIPSMGITLLDGTAPHIIDPKYPGAQDQIWNLGVFLNEEELGKKKDDVIKLCSENSFHYQITFSHLKAAGSLEQTAVQIYQKALLHAPLQTQVKSLFTTSARGNINGQSHFRHLFYSAYTPTGLVDYSPVIPQQNQVFYLDGGMAAASHFIRLAARYAEDLGYSGEIFYSPLLPEEPVHIMIRELDLYITTTRPEIDHYQTVSMAPFVNQNILSSYRTDLEFIQTMKQVLIDEAIVSLSKSKKIHDDIEQLYSGCIDFDQVSEYSDHKIKSLFPA